MAASCRPLSTSRTTSAPDCPFTRAPHRPQTAMDGAVSGLTDLAARLTTAASRAPSVTSTPTGTLDPLPAWGSPLAGGRALSGPPVEAASMIWGRRSPKVTCSSLLLLVANNSSALSPPQGPRASALQPLPRPPTTTPPERTLTCVRSGLERTVKSVPRTPMAASVVLKRNLSLAAWEPRPET